MINDILVFDRGHVRLNRNRAAHQKNNDFLHQWACRNLSSRLDLIKKSFPLGLMLGNLGSADLHTHEKIENLITFDLSERSLLNAQGMRIQGDEEFLPFRANSLDLILSVLTLHSINDLPGALIQLRQALKPDGLFLAAMLGGETLHELRHVLSEAEMRLRDGLSPRVFPFADKPQMGDLLQRAGFNLPVVDSEIVTVTYENAFALMHDLRHMGEGNVIARRDKSIPSRNLFMEAARLYQEKFSDPDGRIRTTFEVIFLIGWSPHESQQKPQQRGSAQIDLADFLQGCKSG